MLGMQSDLPQEVQQVLPADPYAQLALANQIINYAYSQKVAQVEAEAQQLREAVISKQSTIKTLERRVSHLELEVQELQAKNKAAVEDTHRLQTEKSALIETVKKLNRDIAKLDGFKRSVLQHLQDEDEPSHLDRTMAAVDMSSERLVADVLSGASGVKQTPAPTHQGLGSHVYTASNPTTQPPPLNVHKSISGRPGLYGSGSPPRTYASQSPPPTTDRYNINTSSSYANGHPPSSVGPASSAQGSPAPGAAVMDGKEFFRQARARLSYENFRLFLDAIKDLNAGKHNRDETLRYVRDLCGPQHADLYALFEGLLSRHMNGL